VLVLLGGLFVFAMGLFWTIFRRRLEANLPEVTKPTFRTNSRISFWTPTLVGIFLMALGLITIGIYLIWFR
jgi:hypothetical protein